MIDLLLVAASEPLSSMMVALLTFSLCLYPVGLMLGAPCSACCPSCDLCPDLPETLTATYQNFPDQERGPDLVSITFESCNGYGGRAVLTAPGENPGPMAAVEVTDAGFGYAVLGRVEPQVTVQAGGDTAADINIVLEETLDSSRQCLPVWKIKTATLVDGGTGYANGDTLDVLPADGSNSVQIGRLTITTVQEEPALQADADPGEGATFSVTMKEVDYGFPPQKRYAVDAISVGGNGTGYVDGTQLEITPVDSTTIVDGVAQATLRNQRIEPEIELGFGFFTEGQGAVLTPVLQEQTDFFGNPVWTIIEVEVEEGGSGYLDYEQVVVVADETLRETPGTYFFGAARVKNTRPEIVISAEVGSGTGASLEPVLQQVTLADGTTAWRISSIQVVSPGSGYLEGTAIEVSVIEGREIEPLEAVVSLDENGGIASIQIGEEEGKRGYFAVVGVIESVLIWSGGEFYKDSGVPESVQVDFGGYYFSDTGVIESVTVTDPGEYFKESPTAQPIVPPITTRIEQTGGSNGSGAVLTPVVDDDPASDNFGQIVGVTISNGGDGYLAGRNENRLCCGQWLNGKSVVLRRVESPIGCLYRHVWCGSAPDFDGLDDTQLLFRNDGAVDLNSENRCTFSVRQATELVFDWDIDCFSDVIKTTPDDPAAPRITITLGGQYDPYYLNPTGDSNLSTTEGGVVDPQFSGCHSCCRSLGTSPREVVVYLENLQTGPYPGQLPTGTYVLARNFSTTTGTIINIGDPNISALWGPLFGGALNVVLMRCAFFDGEDRQWADIGCGDDCWSRCFTYVAAGYARAPNPYPFPSWSAQGFCSSCQDTPQCAPASGVYTMTDIRDVIGQDGFPSFELVPIYRATIQ